MPIEPDAPGSQGGGPGANQWAIPVVGDSGGLNVSYVSEDCNTTHDRALSFRRSTDGGSTFGSRIRVDKSGQFADNPSRQDDLPAKHAPLAISPSLAFDPTRGRLLSAYQNNIDRATSGADISLQKSDDFGSIWSDAQTISVTSSGRPAPGDQFFPWLAVDGSGGYHAIWYDNRNDPGNKLIETFGAFSSYGAPRGRTPISARWRGTRTSRSSPADASSATTTPWRCRPCTHIPFGPTDGTHRASRSGRRTSSRPEAEPRRVVERRRPRRRCFSPTRRRWRPRPGSGRSAYVRARSRRSARTAGTSRPRRPCRGPSPRPR